MTSTSPESAQPPTLPALGVTPPSGGVGPLAALAPIDHYVPVFYLAICYRCAAEGGFSEPFIDDEDARDDWAAKHAAEQGHVVQLTIDGFEQLAGLHMTGLIRRDDDGGFKFLCPADECKRWNGPYPTAQLAIVSWRAHKPKATR